MLGGNLEALEARDIDGYIATGRAKHAVALVSDSAVAVAAVDAGDVASTCPEQSGPEPVEPSTRVEAMREKIRAEDNIIYGRAVLIDVLDNRTVRPKFPGHQS